MKCVVIVTKNMMNFKFKLVRKEGHDEQHQRTMEREEE
jgi:hypothetical protein